MPVKVAVIQESPVFFAKEETLQKTAALVAEYANQGCQLLVFPESFIPGYPRGFSFGAVVGSRTPAGRDLYAEYHQHSIDLAGEDLARLESMARQHNTFIVIGVTERWGGSLYCSMLYLSPVVGLVGV
ncbi:MAG: nitrilase-related carbon-nitrogen hydrolase, partial [Bacteroidota bacterium]